MRSDLELSLRSLKMQEHVQEVRMKLIEELRGQLKYLGQLTKENIKVEKRSAQLERQIDELRSRVPQEEYLRLHQKNIKGEKERYELEMRVDDLERELEKLRRVSKENESAEKNLRKMLGIATRWEGKSLS